MVHRIEIRRIGLEQYIASKFDFVHQNLIPKSNQWVEGENHEIARHWLLPPQRDDVEMGHTLEQTPGAAITRISNKPSWFGGLRTQFQI